METPPGVYHDWWIWDGETATYVGDLTPELRVLEYKRIWSTPRLEERLTTGSNYYAQLL